MDTLNKWVAIKKTTEKLLTTKGTLYGARTEEVKGLKELVELKDGRIAKLEEINASYSNSLNNCQGALTKSEARAKSRGRWLWTVGVLFLGSVTLHLAR